MNTVYVVKRDGTRELFDISKIKKSIEFAVDGIGVNQLELESKFDQFIKNGIKTSSIQENIIFHAVQLATPQTPDWTKVAGRAFAMDMWANFPLRGKSFREVVHYNIKKGEYTKEILEFYTNSDLDILGEYIDHNKDLEHSYASLVTVHQKYLGKYELNQHMHMVNAMRFGQLEPKESRLDFVKEVYDILSNRLLSLATPFMSNIRKGGNVASCFIISVDDDIDSIFDNVKRIARISKNGGGLGIYLGKLRAKGSSVNGVPKASGTVVQWIKIINDTLVAVNQSFTEDVLVKSDGGDIKISDIKEGDYVITHDGTYQEVLAVKSNENSDPIYKVVTESGVVHATERHPVLVVDGRDYTNKSDIISAIKSKSIIPKWVDIDKLEPYHYAIKI